MRGVKDEGMVEVEVQVRVVDDEDECCLDISTCSSTSHSLISLLSPHNASYQRDHRDRIQSKDSFVSVWTAKQESGAACAL